MFMRITNRFSIFSRISLLPYDICYEVISAKYLIAQDF